MKTRDKVTIKIPYPLYKNLQKVIKDSGFASVTEFIVFILRDVISTKGKELLSSEEVAKIKDKLKKLGYI